MHEEIWLLEFRWLWWFSYWNFLAISLVVAVLKCDIYLILRFSITIFLYVMVSNHDFFIYQGFQLWFFIHVVVLKLKIYLISHFSIATSLYIVFWNATIPNRVILPKFFCSYAILLKFLIFYANSLKSSLLFCFFYCNSWMIHATSYAILLSWLSFQYFFFNIIFLTW